MFNQEHSDAHQVRESLQWRIAFCSLVDLLEVYFQVLMFSVYYSCHSDHTVVTSALELLEQLLKNFPHGFKSILTKQVLQSCYDMEEKVEVSSGIFKNTIACVFLCDKFKSMIFVSKA